MFRISELVASSKTEVGGLLFTDVKFRERHLVCRLRKPKTDQLGKGALVLLHQLPGAGMCPVQCYQSFLAIRSPGPSWFMWMGISI